MNAIVAYLDVLGFSGYTEEDLDGAIRLLGHQEFILCQKIQDGQLYPPSKYPDPSLAALAESHLVDSFKFFLPFSDSIFIVSEAQDKFAAQLSHFLIESLLLIGHVYDDAEDPARPEAVKITEFPSGTTHGERWYPPLWCGGLAFGELRVGGVTGIDDGKETRIPNLAGSAVVKAVAAEKKCRGPRLMCEAGFEKNFGADVQRYFRKVTEETQELLWPAFIYNLNNDPRNEMFEFVKVWRPALALWKSKRGHRAFEHYDEFLKLLVRSFVCWSEIVGCERDASDKLRAWLKADLSDDLVEAYLQR